MDSVLPNVDGNAGNFKGTMMSRDVFIASDNSIDAGGIAAERRKVAVVIPCYKVAAHIEAVVRNVMSRVDHVFVVDDKCPEGTGAIVQATFRDVNVTVLFHEFNQGVGGAMVTGYRAAAEQGYELLVKMDGDDQMDPDYLDVLTAPVALGDADYSKGNRFHAPHYLEEMPGVRVFGNAMLSFLSKISSGYWRIMDPTNGYTCLDAALISEVDLDKVDKRFFFESDLIFRLGIARAVIADVPIPARYGDEVSNLHARNVIVPFLKRHFRNFLRRFAYQYVLRDFNLGTLWTLFGLLMLMFGLGLGTIYLVRAIWTGEPTALGIIMMAALNIIIGLQLLLSAIAFDINAEPVSPVARYLRRRRLPRPVSLARRRKHEAGGRAMGPALSMPRHRDLK